MSLDKFLAKPKSQPLQNAGGRFERFGLSENPFPPEPTVNKDSRDQRINGTIYEVDIRRYEFDKIKDNFLKFPQDNLAHLRLAYIIDTSYIGRGNGKSAFLVNLHREINKEYNLNLSDGVNKCFSLYISPELGGRTKSFLNLVDLVFDSMIESNIINFSLATIRLEAVLQNSPEQAKEILLHTTDIKVFNDLDWYKKNGVNAKDVNIVSLENPFLQDLPKEFPIFKYKNRIIEQPKLADQEDFVSYYKNISKPSEKIKFIFNQIIRLFQAAGFNGAYIFIDDFERIPDFQSARQKRDFAFELRSCLFDGNYLNSRIGFYTAFLVLHAGVPRLISDAWQESGLDNRAPILMHNPPDKHVIPFQKLDHKHATALIKKYMQSFRLPGFSNENELYPFNSEAVDVIGKLSELNAARILKICYNLLEKAVENQDVVQIDEAFVNSNQGTQMGIEVENLDSIDTAESIDLLGKAQGNE